TFTGTVAAVDAALDGLTYRPAANFHGSDRLTVLVDDRGNTGTPGALTASQSIALTVAPVNDPPTAVDGHYLASRNAVLTVTSPGVLAGANDIDDDPLTAVLDVGPAHGALSLAPDGSFTYTPAPSFQGSDSFTFSISDGLSGSEVATAFITVQNDPPRAVDDS